MSHLFSPNFRYTTWRKLWVALAKCEKAIGLPITTEQIHELEKNISPIDFAHVHELEKTLRHDVMAHIHAFAEKCPLAGGIIHLGATSAFVTDNTDLIQIRGALKILQAKTIELLRIVKPIAAKHATTPTVGYTHFQPAQPVSIGKRLCIWMQDFLFDAKELTRVLEEIHFLGLKGAVGTQAAFMALLDNQTDKVEKLDQLLAIEMGFQKLFTISGQTYTRKQDLRVLNTLESLAATAHKCATDLRLLSHLGEMGETFAKKQVGSSAMPHKRNPIRAERICALSRFLITTAQNGAHTYANQWLERSLDDSANRRLALPEAFLAADAILNLLLSTFSDLTIDEKQIRKNLEAELPKLALENLLMLAVKKGHNRQEIHEKLRTGGERAAQAIGFTPKEIEGCRKPNIGRSASQVEEFLSKEVAPFLKEHEDLKRPSFFVEV